MERILYWRYKVTGFIAMMVCCCLFLLFLPALANDSMVGESGRGIYPLESADVRMAYERVEIRLPKGGLEVSVRCRFLLENLSDKEVTAKVGFPSSVSSDGENYVELSDFTASVNGQRVEVKQRTEYMGVGPTVNVMGMPLSKDEIERRSDKRIWYYWPVTFAPKATVEVVNTYNTSMSSNQRVSHFEYVLETGANWKGPIGEAHITIEYPDEREAWLRPLFISPKGYEIQGSTITWRMKNFVPKENIEFVEFYTGALSMLLSWGVSDALSNRQYDGAIREYTQRDLIFNQKFADKTIKYITTGNDFRYYSDVLAENVKKDIRFNEKALRDESQRLYVSSLRNEIYARHGKKFKDRIYEHLFTMLKWYKVDEGFTEANLNDKEKRNIKFIANYERKMGWR